MFLRTGVSAASERKRTLGEGGSIVISGFQFVNRG
jgi:hypothetical protein